MKVYHATAQPEEVLRYGFRESVGVFPSGRSWAGVWLTDRPIDPGDTAYLHGATLELEIPEEVLAPYLWPEAGKPYRQFLVPAHLANEALAASRKTSFTDDYKPPSVPG
jgi:hypothetical protein